MAHAVQPLAAQKAPSLKPSARRLFRLLAETFLFLPAFFLGISPAVSADEPFVYTTHPEPGPYAPRAQTYASTSASFRVRIKPRGLLPARAIVSHRAASGWFTRDLRFKLVNHTGPSAAAISEDGRYVVTLGDIGEDKWTAHAVAIYREGSLVGALGLRDLVSQDEAAELQGYLPGWSLSSDCGAPYFDIPRDQVVLGILGQGSTSDGRLGCFALPINLSTGVLAISKDRVFPKLEVITEAVEDPPPATPPSAWASVVCGSGGNATPETPTVAVSTWDILDHATNSPMPTIPKIAWKCCLQRAITLEVVVSDSGQVDCVRATGFTAMGIQEAAVPALRAWCFRPFLYLGRPVRAVGSIRLRLGRRGGIPFLGSAAQWKIRWPLPQA